MGDPISGAAGQARYSTAKRTRAARPPSTESSQRCKYKIEIRVGPRRTTEGVESSDGKKAAMHNVVGGQGDTTPRLPRRLPGARWATARITLIRRRGSHVRSACSHICPLLAMYNPRYASPPPMYMNSLNRCRIVFPFFRPTRRASRVHDGIVRSASPYGAYFFDFATVLFRSDRGRCRFGIGYANLRAAVAFTATAGCSARTGNVRYSSLNFGLSSSVAPSSPGR